MNRQSESRHKHAPKQVRGIPPEEVSAFDRAAAAAGSNRSAITRQLWAWFAGSTEPPARPTAQMIEERQRFEETYRRLEDSSTEQ